GLPRSRELGCPACGFPTELDLNVPAGTRASCYPVCSLFSSEVSAGLSYFEAELLDHFFSGGVLLYFSKF
ncbi:MAG: hypothetical protein O3A87_06655, partial [Verrucomicrobia bacterium]|nr:hypothetical protein [Verrucomicrobiota bacterium]